MACSIYTGRLCGPGTVLSFSSRNLFREGILGLVGERGGQEPWVASWMCVVLGKYALNRNALGFHYREECSRESMRV